MVLVPDGLKIKYKCYQENTRMEKYLTGEPILMSSLYMIAVTAPGPELLISMPMPELRVIVVDARRMKFKLPEHHSLFRPEKQTK